MTHSTAPTRLEVPRDPKTVYRAGSWSVILVVLIALHVLAFQATEFRPEALVTGARGMANFISEAFPPDLSAEVLQKGIEGALTTLWIGLLGTTVSVPFALLLAVFAARTTTPNQAVYQVARGILSFFRAVPDIVFALIFVTAVGLGPFAGVLALICHNTGVMGKLWAEAMEDVDQGPEQALRTAGASRWQVVANATIPNVLPQLTGLLLYRFDVNVRSSLVLGLVGAGGIGLLINKAIKTFQFDEMLTYLIIILIVIIAVDLASAWIRKRLQ
ncbi:phosphonate transport system permease protein [Mycolicibacterium mucogenicum 261Sha1.1M5]|uniref:Phosphonate transport system permease protein n=1 Tax=Leucobacter aridicollis TaxID=283878 RepID=A0A852R0A3_9MICO|nr:phosphonate ABC transporter, permease protein PhnE [Leucobacter aridicollis]MBL3680853.1 phosphonate ABC transporter, permease protein PhnE [Leucobacter aridicollis]MCS3429149.1 phosphonate transport system permease protein [Leucobacter aridicollis]NYD28143.1 phosphonate transport system permease protein [Leucobacter aridicollis]RKQ85749.1 phosphonate transport system permease protein [Mycolicibacterium mucogenicum 261Sha1.1M5]